jgi:hypothetical protein
VTMHLPAPIAIDPRACDWCGLLIDRHRMVVEGDGPDFYCLDLSPDEMTLPELVRRAEYRRQEAVAAIIARWEAIDEEIAHRKPITAPRAVEPYRPPQSTIDAFWHVVSLCDPERFKRWLAERPRDAPYLLELLEGT